MSGRLFELAWRFALLSLLAFGGANSVVPEIRRLAVEHARWMSDPEFARLFAISQAAPGPNFLIASLVGWKAAGLAGAAVATLALATPSCLLVLAVARAWERWRATPWRIALGEALAPVAAGLVSASALILVRATDQDLRLALITGVSATVAAVTRLNPLWVLAAAAAAGAAGLV